MNEVVLRPFGEGGAELGMTRAEMMEHIHFISEGMNATSDTQLQIFFAWLVAMFFVAHRLSRAQFLVVSALFTYFTWDSWISMSHGWHAFIAWQEYAGLHHQVLDMTGNLSGIVEKSMQFMRTVSSDAIFYWAVYASCMWFGFSCRKNQPKELGSPL
ncbi:MAG: hypothetical protein ABJN62_09780 [Halioglobus sp.]